MKPSYEELEQKLAESQREFRAADATIENLQMQLNAEREAKLALAAENAGLNSFVDALLSIAWQGGSTDGADIEELALKHGLIRQEVYRQDDHENLVDDPGNFEDGDPVYFRVETPATDAFLAEVRAQGVDAAIEELNQLAERSEKEAPIAAGHHRSAALYLHLLSTQIRKGVQS
ncbi:hypothetical protein R4Q63_002727 [Enterobacter cloacae]|nr:hypothetical protein [Enterobacter cloacae]